MLHAIAIEAIKKVWACCDLTQKKSFVNWIFIHLPNVAIQGSMLNSPTQSYGADDVHHHEESNKNLKIKSKIRIKT